jgi:sn-glycerol 3-phosphate transport system substrate-binding protein
VRKGKSYWVPFARSTPLFYYNKDMFKAAGLPDKAPETWDELVQMAPKLMKEGGARYAFAHIAPYSAWTFQAVIRQFGGRYSDENFNILIDQPNGIQAGNFWRQSVVDGWAYAPQSNTTDLQTGITATTLASTGSLAGITQTAKFNFGTAFLPRAKEFNVCTGGAGFAVMNKTTDEKKLAAMKFITFATSPQITTFWSQQTGYIPARVFAPNGDIIIGKGLEEIVINKKDARDALGSVAATLKTEVKPVAD